MQALSTTTDHIPEGAHLAEPVRDLQGQMLLPAGAQLSASTLRALEQRGIATVFIDLPEPTTAAGALAEPEDPHAARARVEARLAHLFRPALREGQLNPLFHLILQFRVEEQP